MQFPQILDMEQGMIANQDKFDHQPQQPPRRVIRPPEGQHHQPPPPQKCPRCDSTNTKFCYYNNYSLSQPRYFCKACRRYWTHGGTLRNVPVGGGCRKSKRPRTSSSSSADAARSQQPVIPPGQGLRGFSPVMNPPPAGNSFYTGGAFMSSLAGLEPITAGFNQGLNLGSRGGGGGSQFGANMELLQGTNIPTVIRPTHHAPQPQFQGQNHEMFTSHQGQNHEMFTSHQGLFPQRPTNSWTPNFVNRSTGSTAMASSSSARSSGFWTSSNFPDGNNQAVTSSSFSPNQWLDSSNNNYNQAGFDPSQ